MNNKENIVFLNGEFIKSSDAKVSIFDRGFLFADGVYEVIPVYNNKLFFFNEHLIRLQNSLDNIFINYKLDFEYWHNICSQLIEKNGANRPIYIQITRGAENKRAHDFSHDITPTLLAFNNSPMKLGNCLDRVQNNEHMKTIILPDNRWQKCHIKSIALLGNVLLRQEGLKQGAEEILLKRDTGNIVEATYSNFFIVKNNIIYTPPLNHQLLPGITRSIVINLCKENNIKLIEQDINEEMILDADEVFLSSSIKEISPVAQVNNTNINNGKPGPVWQRVANLYLNFIKNQL